MTDANQPYFSMDKIYVKDISLEIPHAPQIFMERDNPEIEVQLQSQGVPLEEGIFEVEVVATVTAKLGEKVMFLIEVKQAGIFQIRNIGNEEIEPVLAVTCPNILFPYLREVVSDVSVRGGFAPVMLNPLNFEILYQQRKQQEAEAAATTH